ncbi:uncharacterized protein LOC141700937 isoform X4 [Apium graveolens]|uniref:uncharacterized protein LOC141700937 isoform X4 n=1 Tax=Apium graveolens TaxID=4045 RepID=UPI003D79F985
MNLGSCTNVRRTTELPEEIMNEEILVRLPVEDLLRVRCISRKSFGFSLLSRYKETMIHPPRPKVHALCNSRLVGSINGYLIGFCWDSVENDYQVIVCYIFSSFRQGVVYSSNSNSWTKLVVPKFVFPSRVFESAFGVEEVTPTTIVNECPYWCYSRFLPKMRRKYTAIVKFEVQTQKFRSLPEIDYALVRGQNYNFANFMDCLAIMVYKSESPKTAVEIYILHEKSGVWNKVFTIGSPQSNLNIGSLLQGFKFGDEIVIQVIDKVFCYDLQSDEVKGFLGSSNQCKVLECFSYTASFVFLEGMKRVQSRTIEEVVV